MRFSLSKSSKDFIDKVLEDDLLSQSAALAYYMLLSLAPLSVLLLVVWSFFPDSSAQDLLHFIRPWVGPAASQAVEAVIAESRQPNLRAWAGILTFVSIAFFGTSGFNQLQWSLNKIWQRNVSTAKSFFAFRAFSLLILLGLLVFLILSSFVLGILESFKFSIGFFSLPIIPFLMFLLLSVGTTCLFRWVSGRQLPWAACFQGALVSAFYLALEKKRFKFMSQAQLLHRLTVWQGPWLFFLFGFTILRWCFF